MNNTMNSPLFKACSEGDLRQVKMLLKKGENINGNDTGMAPLWAAVRNGRNSVVKYSVKNGAQVVTKGGHKSTTKHIAGLKSYEAKKEVTPEEEIKQKHFVFGFSLLNAVLSLPLIILAITAFSERYCNFLPLLIRIPYRYCSGRNTPNYLQKGGT